MNNIYYPVYKNIEAEINKLMFDKHFEFRLKNHMVAKTIKQRLQDMRKEIHKIGKFYL